MTGNPFRFARSCSLAMSEVAVCSIGPHTFVEVTLQLRIVSAASYVIRCVASRARMPGIVCIASRNPRKQRVRPLPRSDEKKDRERREPRRCSWMHLLYIHRPRFPVAHLGARIRKRNASFSLLFSLSLSLF